MMPFYDLKCEACGHPFTEYARVDEREKATCPECGHVGSEVQIPRRIHVVYRTDGFAHQALEAEKLKNIQDSAVEEGFQSQMEIEESVAQGIDRAHKIGVPPERIVGKEVLETGKVPSLEDAVADNLY